MKHRPTRRRGHLGLIPIGLAVVLAYPVQVFADAVPLVVTTDSMHARYYSPNLGRFMSVDPVGGTVGSSQSWNRYSYVLNNPLSMVDPAGEEAIVTIDDDNSKISVEVPIDIYGNAASDEVAGEIEGAIEEFWNGFEYTDPNTGQTYSVVVDAQVSYVGDSAEGASALNQMEVSTDISGSFVNGSVLGMGKHNSGGWASDAINLEFAHEAGHLMGLGDDYSSIFGDVFPGHEGHMMGGIGTYGQQDRNISVAQHEVNGVVGPVFVRRTGQQMFSTSKPSVFRVVR